MILDSFARFPPNIFSQTAKKGLAICNKTCYNTNIPAGVMELADVVDSKSTAGDSVPVRVRPPAPTKKSLLSTDKGDFFQ